MKKLLIISLLFIHLLGNTEFNQILHLPYLIEHYSHHLKSGGTITFADFVSEHYGKGDNDPSDNQEEKDLPFMQVHQHSLSIAILPSTRPFSKHEYIIQSAINATMYIIDKLPSGFFGSEIKPPRAIA